MGIINVTPDSFSDGGKFSSVKAAVWQAKKLKKEGADIIDIGGEASGPNSKNVSEKEEIRRVIPVIKAIKKELSIPISIDTYKSKVAKEALKAGADIVNDITALRGDKLMAKVVADSGCPIIMMYSKDPSARTTLKAKKYSDPIATISTFLKKQREYALKQGVKKEQIILDPGMGHFVSSDPNYSYQILLKLSELRPLGHPILIGLSRKSFLGGELSKRDELGKGPSALAYLNGARIIRTHDVKGLKEFFDVLAIN